jgi:hypothetical protein
VTKKKLQGKPLVRLTTLYKLFVTKMATLLISRAIQTFVTFPFFHKATQNQSAHITLNMRTKETYLKSFTAIKKLKRIQKVEKTENCMLEKNMTLVQVVYETGERSKS